MLRLAFTSFMLCFILSTSTIASDSEAEVNIFRSQATVDERGLLDSTRLMVSKVGWAQMLQQFMQNYAYERKFHDCDHAINKFVKTICSEDEFTEVLRNLGLCLTLHQLTLYSGHVIFLSDLIRFSHDQLVDFLSGNLYTGNFNMFQEILEEEQFVGKDPQVELIVNPELTVEEHHDLLLTMAVKAMVSNGLQNSLLRLVSRLCKSLDEAVWGQMEKSLALLQDFLAEDEAHLKTHLSNLSLVYRLLCVRVENILNLPYEEYQQAASQMPSLLWYLRLDEATLAARLKSEIDALNKVYLAELMSYSCDRLSPVSIEKSMESEEVETPPLYEFASDDEGALCSCDDDSHD